MFKGTILIQNMEGVLERELVVWPEPVVTGDWISLRLKVQEKKRLVQLQEGVTDRRPHDLSLAVFEEVDVASLVLR